MTPYSQKRLNDIDHEIKNIKRQLSYMQGCSFITDDDKRTLESFYVSEQAKLTAIADKYRKTKVFIPAH